MTWSGQLAEGVRPHVADIAGRLPNARIVLQLDEPSVPAVLSGRLPTASGLGTLRAIDIPVVRAGLADVLTAATEARLEQQGQEEHREGHAVSEPTTARLSRMVPCRRAAK